MCCADVDGEITAVQLSQLHITHRANGTHPGHQQSTGSQDPTECSATENGLPEWVRSLGKLLS